MENKVSQDEMNALLNTTGDPGRASATNKTGAETVGRKLTVYDFRRPDRVPKRVLQSLQLLHDHFCTNASASLSVYLRALTEISIVSVDQTNFSEFIHSLADPTCLTAISMRPLNGMAVLEMSLDLAFPLMDRLLGGAGHVPDSSRKMTEIEKNVIQGVHKIILAALAEAWKPVAEVTFHTHSSETRPPLLQVAPPNDVVVVLAFEMKVGETRGHLHLCFPYSALEPISGKFETEAAVQRETDNSSDLKKVLRIVLRTPVEVTSQLPGTMTTVRDLLSIAKGDIIKLDPKVEDCVNLHVGGIPAFQASALDIDGHKGAGVIRRVAD
jgi:flagellar motor switch protein FliM